MNEQALDSVTKRAAEVISRRNSLLSLGSLALAASLLGPATTEAKKGKGKNKKRCRAQFAQCREGILKLCETFEGPGSDGAAECFNLFGKCCEFLNGPNTSAAFACAAQTIEDLRAV